MARGSQAVTHPGREDEVPRLLEGQPRDGQTNLQAPRYSLQLEEEVFMLREGSPRATSQGSWGPFPERPEESPGAGRKQPAEPGDLVTWRARFGRAL